MVIEEQKFSGVVLIKGKLNILNLIHRVDGASLKVAIISIYSHDFTRAVRLTM